MSEAAVAYEIETAAPGAVVGKGAFFSPFLASRWIRFLDAKPRTVEAYERSLRPFFKFIKENGITQPTREDKGGHSLLSAAPRGDGPQADNDTGLCSRSPAFLPLDCGGGFLSECCRPCEGREARPGA